MTKPRMREMETHHNQALTFSAQERLHRSAARKKVFTLGLDEKEQAALSFLGGLPALKTLLCPEGLCIRCRQATCVEGSPWNAMCPSCASDHESDQKPYAPMTVE